MQAAEEEAHADARFGVVEAFEEFDVFRGVGEEWVDGFAEYELGGRVEDRTVGEFLTGLELAEIIVLLGSCFGSGEGERGWWD